MQSLEGNRRGQRLLFVAHVLGLLTAFYFYVLLRIRPELFYQQKPNVFLFDSYYFGGFWGEPGGPVDYVAAFLSPLFAYGRLGAGVVTLLTALICLATRRFIAGVSGNGGRFVFLIPAVLILMILGQYCHPVWLCVGLLVVLVSANSYVRIAAESPIVRLAAFVVLSALAYYAAVGLYVVFALLCAVFEWRVERQRRLATAYVLCAALPAAAGVGLFELSVLAAYRGAIVTPNRYWLATPASMPIAMTIWVGSLLFFPLAALFLARRRQVTRPPVADTPAQTELTAKGGHVADHPFSGRRLAVQSIVLLALGVGADVAAFDFSTHCLLRIARSAEHERWSDVLTHAGRLPSTDAHAFDLRTVFHVNRALYFSGGLLDRMFTFPQSFNAPTLALRFEKTIDLVRTVPLEGSDILFDLGRINESEHLAYEAMEMFGERPRTLERLVHIHVLKGQPDAARRFLFLMERSLLHSRWARRLQRRLDADPRLSDVPAVASHRELMVVRDFTGKLDAETLFIQLLQRNRRNRMAFEYLMAYYLMTRQLDKLVANLRRLDDFDFPRLPRHCEEALVVYLATSGEQDFDLGRYQIRPETWQRHREFGQALGQFQGNPIGAFMALQDDFGDSYFFFHVFGRSVPTR